MSTIKYEWKASNGRRKSATVQVSAKDYNDPVKRAAIISGFRIPAGGRLVNWEEIREES